MISNSHDKDLMKGSRLYITESYNLQNRIEYNLDYILSRRYDGPMQRGQVWDTNEPFTGHILFLA